MVENESVPKMEGTDYQLSVDFLSDLPLSIIHIILGRIPFREAVRTSILSREWRYTWATLPHIVIDKECANPVDKLRAELQDCSVDESSANPQDNPREELENRMEDIITHVLSRHRGPIHRFQLSFCFEKNSPDVDEWILRLSRKGIKELILDMGLPRRRMKALRVHSSLYACEKLTTLELHTLKLKLPPPPWTFKGFSFLRCLSLYGVSVAPNAMETLVANSPLLERLSLVECETKDLRMDAPNLKYMYIMGACMRKGICIFAPLLAEMVVFFNRDCLLGSPSQQQKQPLCHYTNFLSGLTNLEKLTGGHGFVKYLSKGIESCCRTLVFPHLKEIELKDINFEDIKEISAVACLITSAPNLYKLKISTNFALKNEEDYYASESESQDVCFSDFGCAPDFAFAKLRFIYMIDVTGHPSEAEFMVFLLQSSPVLEEMYVDHSCAPDDGERELLVDRLVGCGWACPTAKLNTP